MPLLDFPPGDNATDTVIHGAHFSIDILREWKYQYYSNDTLSNGTYDYCFITLPPYTPTGLLTNGTFLNSTWCYTPHLRIGTRGAIGMGFVVLFALGLILTLVNLHRHGRLYLPVEKRFYPVGRRWQWYYSVIVCACAMVCLIVNVDVDRLYLSEIPILIFSFFWYLIQWFALALVWESVRHWGSWMERQYIDPNPFILPQDGGRYKFELLIPLVFYAFLFLNFFLIVPRNWGPLELQRSPEQTLLEAVPAGTDVRLKVGSFALFGAWLIIIICLRHSIHQYQPRNRGLFNRFIGIFKLTPLRIKLLLVLSLIMIGYQAYVPWSWENSPMNITGNVVSIYVGGFIPTLLIIYVNIVSGFLRPNEDLELIRQRRVRGSEADAELRITHKPGWWRIVRGDARPFNESMRDTIARNVREVGGRKPTTTEVEQPDMEAANPTAGASASGTGTTRSRDVAADPATVEMGVMQTQSPTRESRNSDLPSPTLSRPGFEPYSGRSDRRRNERTLAAVAGMLFPASTTGRSAAERRADLTSESPAAPPPYQERQDRACERQPSERSSSAASINRPPQQVRSMLDV